MALVQKGTAIEDPRGKLGVLLPGMGAVATTFIAGVELAKTGIAQPIGSLTQMGTVRLGKRTEDRVIPIKDFVPLAGLPDLVFGGWDIFDDNCYQAACKAGVLQAEHLRLCRDALETLRPWKAVFDQRYVKKLSGPNVKRRKNKYELAEAVIEDITRFIKEHNLDRTVMIWCGSTEAFLRPNEVHRDLPSFERGLAENHEAIAPSMIYAYAAIQCGIPFANGAPNLTADIPALTDLARERNVPVAGKDFKSGQTFIKTVLAPALKARLLGITGWFSMNILGNRDGEVLDDPESLRTKEESKLSPLEYILQPQFYPDLYGSFYHKVKINYYPPRGDNKESWDNIDLFGWLGYPMQLKINFLCRDSILAAPIVLDLVLFLDLARRCKMRGIQEWLSFYFKSPMTAPGLYPEHDTFIQLMKLKNTLRYIRGEEPITHLGVEYYD